MAPTARANEHGLRSYLTGLALALLLTAIPFALVAARTLSPSVTFAVIAVAAIIQILVHLRFFLHLRLLTSPRENVFSIVFAAVLILIMFGGSFWIMLDLSHRVGM